MASTATTSASVRWTRRAEHTRAGRACGGTCCRIRPAPVIIVFPKHNILPPPEKPLPMPPPSKPVLIEGEGLHGAARVRAVTAVALSVLLALLDYAIANVALPTIAGDLHV